MSTTPPVVQRTRDRSIFKVASAALAGTSIEFYDFFLYATAAALVFPHVFFPQDTPRTIALLASFSTFAVGFVARPIGAVIFGRIGDLAGRKPALVGSLSLMGVATTLIGLLPSFADAGAVAPAALIALRFLQGLALGGQWGGAVLLVIESAPSHRRGYYGAFAQAGAPIGTVLANLAFLILTLNVPHDLLISWAWRVPFLLSLALIALGIFIQLRLHDSPAFLELERARHARELAHAKALAVERGVRTDEALHVLQNARRTSPVLEALRSYPREIMLTAGTLLGQQVSFYTLVAFAVTYGTDLAGPALSNSDMLIAVLLGAVAMIPGVILSALISDRYGRRGVLMISAALLGAWAFALFPLIDSRSLAAAIVALMVGQFLNGMVYGPIAPLFAETFSIQVRCSGVSLGYQIGTLAGGAVAPLVATALFARFQSSMPVSMYICLACILSVASVWRLRETYQQPLGAGCGEGYPLPDALSPVQIEKP